MLYVTTGKALGQLGVASAFWGFVLSSSVLDWLERRQKDDRMIDIWYLADSVANEEVHRLATATDPIAKAHGLTEDEHIDKINEVYNRIFKETMLTFRAASYKEQRKMGGYLTYLRATVNMQGIGRFLQLL